MGLDPHESASFFEAGSGSGSASELKSGSGSAKFKSLEAKNRAVNEWRPGGSKWRHGGPIDYWSQIPNPITLKRSWIRIKANSWIRIGIKVTQIHIFVHRSLAMSG